jgi:nucleotide-binding universal stress UspA family protein
MKSFEPKLILVPTDFSDAAAHALRYASNLAGRFGAHLLVVYADEFMPPVDFTAAPAGEFALAREAMVEEAREELETHVERNISSRVPFDARVIVASTINGILDEMCQSGADLVVMGTHGRSGVRRLIVGSITESIMRLAKVPVIAVNATAKETAEIQKILCPVTYNSACRQALGYATGLAPAAPVVLLRGVENVELQDTVGELICLQEWVPVELAGRCELKVLPSQTPAEEIVEFGKATNADLIALAVPSDRSLADVLRGTIAERIVRQADCPVLTVNGAAARVSERERELVTA